MSSTADCLLYTTVILPLLYQNTPSPNPLCCSMQGILCDQNQKITQISIGKDRNAIGSIPSELSKLDKLSVLQLFQNNLKGSIPPSLGSLPLTDLSLGGNQLTGSIPPEIGNIASLKILYLDLNKLTGPIPQELGKLKNLQILRIDKNSLTGPLPLSLKNVADLSFDPANAPGEAPVTQSNTTPSKTPSPSSTNSIDPALNEKPPISGAMIAIISIGGVVVLGLIIFAIYYYLRNKRQNEHADVYFPSDKYQATNNNNSSTTFNNLSSNPPTNNFNNLSTNPTNNFNNVPSNNSPIQSVRPQSSLQSVGNRNSFAVPLSLGEKMNAGRDSLNIELMNNQPLIPSARPGSFNTPDAYNNAAQRGSYSAGLNSAPISPFINSQPIQRPEGILDDGYPDKIFYFATSYGQEPFLDLIQYLFLPLNINLKAAKSYSPQFQDEMEISENDIIQVLEHHYDGWCLGMNITTGLKGQFPLACTLPPYPTEVTLIYSHERDDHFINHKLIQAALLSFPTQIALISRDTTPVELRDCVEYFQSPVDGIQKCVVCGPPYYNENLVDLIKSYSQERYWNISTIQIISADSRIA